MKTCKNCNTDISELHHNKTFCDNDCLKEYKQHQNILESHQKYTEHGSYAECKICSHRAPDLTSHIERTHSMKCIDYKHQYDVNTVSSDSFRKDISSRTVGALNPGYQHNGKFSALSNNFIKNKGLTTAEIKENKEIVSKKISKSNKENGNNHRTIAYWLKEADGNLVKATELLSNHQTWFSLDICIQKHGEIEGTKIWKTRQEKWLTTLDAKTDEEKELINRSKAASLNYRTFYKSSKLCKMYLINISRLDNTESFIKIGLTSKTINKRFASPEFRQIYKINILHQITGQAKDLAGLEQQIIREFKHSKYTPKSKFAGWTECFTSETNEQIIDVMKVLNE